MGLAGQQGPRVCVRERETHSLSKASGQGGWEQLDNALGKVLELVVVDVEVPARAGPNRRFQVLEFVLARAGIR